MYEELMHTLRAFFSSGILRTTLVLSLGIVVIVFAALLSPAFRERLRDARSRGGWRGGSIGLASGIFKFLLVFLLVRFFITALVFQAKIFEQQHGRVTEKNRSAVLMKWGCSHEQRELSVSHTRKRTWVTRQLFVKGEGERSDSFWLDEESDPQFVGGRRPKIVGRKEEIRDVPVKQESIVRADIDVVLKNSPRTLGNANYAGYEDGWSLAYVVANRSEFDTTAHMSFPLPAKTGLFDQMRLELDGTNILPDAEVRDSRLFWRADMPAGSTKTVGIGYQSRGLEFLRYIPKRMTQTGHYRVSMTLHGIPPDKLDYPIGSMPPVEKIEDIRAAPYALTWKLDNALTSYDIGVKLPDAEQPDYHFARLLHESPPGLIFLFVLLALSRILLRQPVRPEFMAILGTAYALHYTFMGRLADLLPGFALPFVISSTAIGLVIAWFRLKDCEPRLLRVLDSIVFLVVIVLYPLAIVDKDITSFWMQLLYLLALVHVCTLLVSRRFSTH